MSGAKQTGRTAVTPGDVLDFWFAPEHREYWFNSTPAFDAEISRRFGATARILADPVAVTGLDWRADPASHLAEIIVLDQFPRNMFRGTPAAFAWDDQALDSARSLVEREGDLALEPERRKFAYMPYMHAEDLVSQDRCVALCATRLPEHDDTVKHAEAHRDVIRRFGRFPHRNAVLGRDSTPEEIAFLENGGYNPS